MKNILIADDDSDLLGMYTQVFLNHGIVVEATKELNVVEAFLKKNKYDIIILDLLFPSNDSLETIKNIRSPGSPNEKTPIIALTNLSQGEKTKKAIEYGANKCLLKANYTPREVYEIAKELTSTNPKE